MDVVHMNRSGSSFLYHSFMVRIWKEGGREPGNFQITAESVQSGRTYRFDNLTSLLDFLQASVDSDNLTKTNKEREEVDKPNFDPSD